MMFQTKLSGKKQTNSQSLSMVHLLRVADNTKDRVSELMIWITPLATVTQAMYVDHTHSTLSFQVNTNLLSVTYNHIFGHKANLSPVY